MRRVMCLVALLAACQQDSTPGADAGAGADASTGEPDAQSGTCGPLDETACLARADCHAGYRLDQCENVLGYCPVFLECRDGRADCAGPASCDIIEPFCAGPYVHSYTATCYGPCVRADQCAGCLDGKLKFTQADGCANDGSVEFCIPPLLQAGITALAPTVQCAAGTGRAGCDPQTQLLCTFPTDESTCTAVHGALTDAAWGTLCAITWLPEVSEIVPTFFE